jgi:HSP20 family protein
MMKRKRNSLFSRITGAITPHDEEENFFTEDEENIPVETEKDISEEWENIEEGELTVDMYEDGDDLIIKSMIAGVEPSELDVSISRDTVTIKGKRQDDSGIFEDNGYIYRELYWGSFSRVIPLTVEIDPDTAEATERNGLLTIRMPKIDRGKASRVKVKGN